MVEPGHDIAALDYQEGRIGKLPEWVRVMMAAQEMGVAPWDLIKRDDIWTEWGLFLRQVKTEAQEKRNKQGNS